MALPVAGHLHAARADRLGHHFARRRRQLCPFQAEPHAVAVQADREGQFMKFGAIEPVGLWSGQRRQGPLRRKLQQRTIRAEEARLDAARKRRRTRHRAREHRGLNGCRGPWARATPPWTQQIGTQAGRRAADVQFLAGGEREGAVGAERLPRAGQDKRGAAHDAGQVAIGAEGRALEADFERGGIGRVADQGVAEHPRGAIGGAAQGDAEAARAAAGRHRRRACPSRDRPRPGSCERLDLHAVPLPAIRAAT